MYEDYMQNLFDTSRQYQNTYGGVMENYPYSYCSQNMYRERPYTGNIPYMTVMQNRRDMSIDEIENCYPEIYKVVYPMVRKVCSQKRGTLNREMIENMTEEVCSNVETNDAIKLNITLGNEVRTSEKTDKNITEKIETEDRSPRRNFLLNDLVKILILRELTGRPGCWGSNCRPIVSPKPPRPMPPRPPMPRYGYDNMFYEEIEENYLNPLQ